MPWLRKHAKRSAVTARPAAHSVSSCPSVLDLAIYPAAGSAAHSACCPHRRSRWHRTLLSQRVGWSGGISCLAHSGEEGHAPRGRFVQYSRVSDAEPCAAASLFRKSPAALLRRRLCAGVLEVLKEMLNRHSMANDLAHVAHLSAALRVLANMAASSASSCAEICAVRLAPSVAHAQPRQQRLVSSQ